MNALSFFCFFERKCFLFSNNVVNYLNGLDEFHTFFCAKKTYLAKFVRNNIHFLSE